MATAAGKAKAPATKPRAKKAKEPVVVGIKGTDVNLRCRGFQFEVGKTYEVRGKIVACSNGFHSCPLDDDGHPLSVFEYYAPGVSRYFEVEAKGETDRQGSKIASAKLTIGVEVSIGELTRRAIEWVFARAKPEGESATGDQGAASATGDQGAASATGDQGAASATGNQGAASATGYQGAASATGTRGAASATGYQGAASATGTRGAASATGYQGAASATGTRGAASATGYQGAASATGTRGAASATGTQGAASATGDQGAASATGTRGAASATGDQGAASATGGKSAAMASGYDGRVKATKGCAIFALERDGNWKIISTASGIVGRDGLKADTFYCCVGGKLVEVSA